MEESEMSSTNPNLKTTLSKPALWFSRHTPTQEQIDEIHLMGYQLHDVQKGILWGQVELTEWPQVHNLIHSILQIAENTRAKAIFGVFPTPILSYIANQASFAIQNGDYPHHYSIPCYAAWNIQRSQENQKPTFQHKQWLYIGRLV
jgi:hypothetical protein